MRITKVTRSYDPDTYQPMYKVELDFTLEDKLNGVAFPDLHQILGKMLLDGITEHDAQTVKLAAEAANLKAAVEAFKMDKKND